ncbi:S-adenosyl-L-methionine-dependent methyltransferase [Lasiosphaeris hirsuta]|uniref:S-adenosyl-L-methionine-dependent methyltransferase n=1 Tax=Lasiosphaeris hirsuta TaxID=260670 RepID=A0AA40B1U9_9PEZI|nr:S-adenosyl-L-methionine-dependent methyltransferase [Lasiosphaeris hirsuta]
MSKRRAEDAPVTVRARAESRPAKIEALSEEERQERTEPSEDVASSTASITSSILEYRALNGRTFHSAAHAADYFMPNDGQQQESLDLVHHYLTLIMDGLLYLAPIPSDTEGLTVLDVGTGTGIWAIDFADVHSDADVVGTDLSPIQPSWIPRNVRFEIEDATVDWSFRADSFDFIHMRYLLGGISDWTALFERAYRCCKPGGWVESVEVEPILYSDDGTTDGNPFIEKFATLFLEASNKTGKSFIVPSDDVQRLGMEAAGFSDLQVVDFKVPMGGWPRDPRLAEVGRISHVALETDIEGYTMMLWHHVLQWPLDGYQPFLDGMRKTLRDKRTHPYMKLRVVYGRKSETE